jgi:UDP-N-acetylmuramate dehydrogenase
MKISENTSLASYTSFNVGGPAEQLITIEDTEDIAEAIRIVQDKQLWLLGYGTNVLISDLGLPGTTLLFRNQEIEVSDDTIIAEAGAGWDDLVQKSIDSNLWGLELLTGIPGSVGGAALININAYGQAQSDRAIWVECFDKSKTKLVKLSPQEIAWGYKQSLFQTNPNLIIGRVAYRLEKEPTTEVNYQPIIDMSKELDIKLDTLKSRREAVFQTRERAGSIFVYGRNNPKTVGSFFKNPLVTKEQADYLIGFDETGKTKEQIAKMNQVHGGDKLRVSAAHVLLAAGFKRGQSWGYVRLHSDHLLKIENTGQATAADIYNVAQTIIQTVKDKFGIVLEPEVRIMGGF